MYSTNSSNASTLSSVNDDFNPILPTTEQIEHVLARSRHIWQGHLETAKSLKSIPQESLTLSNRLDRFPALPDDLKGVSFLQGQSTWKRSSPGTWSRPTKCEVSPLVPFANWMGETDRTNQSFEHKNGVFIMLAGWIFSQVQSRDPVVPCFRHGINITTSEPLYVNCASTETRLGRPYILSSIAPASPCQLLENFENISKYMTMSSNPRFLTSALWSTFWEPGVDCNLVSPWCDGIIEILEPLVRNDLELLAHTLALRRPLLAPFWYGALLFGRTKLTERLIPFLKTQQAPTPMGPIPEVAPWTRSPQSYMDLCGSGAYLHEDNTISRADAWRLRHDCWEIEAGGLPFRNTPLLGWPPFGFMHPDDLELEVHPHSSCERHRWQYDHWTWQFENGHNIHDESCKGQQHEDWNSEFGSHSSFHSDHNISYMSNNVATESAVGAAFQWTATEIDEPSRSIFAHPWVGAGAFPQQDEPLVDSPPSFSEEANERVDTWRQNVCEWDTFK
ncbi:hypothetical protein DL98DRAFT_540103 [Cadophora sp. DSE1049]|nr:hypothetical protein DL98DRAFT_540103 [Cadophora sp. DSE1049]